MEMRHVLRWSICLSAILISAIESPAQPISENCSEIMEYESTILLCPSPLPPIRRIHIEGSHGRGKELREPDCSTFKPDIATVRRYFSKARLISERDWMHEIVWVSCRAHGSLVLEDGRKAYWGISAARSANVIIEGEPKQKIYLYCPECDFSPFWR